MTSYQIVKAFSAEPIKVVPGICVKRKMLTQLLTQQIETMLKNYQLTVT